MIDDDRPIQDAQEDKLGRHDFAKTVARAIATISLESSVVIGISGPWGCGKTSVINLVCQEIKRSNENPLEEYGRTLIVHYNPWKFSSSVNLIDNFFL